MAPTIYGFIHTYGARAGDMNGDHIGQVVEIESREALQHFLTNDYHARRNGGIEAGHTRLRYSNPTDRRAIDRYRKRVSNYGSSERNIYYGHIEEDA